MSKSKKGWHGHHWIRDDKRAAIHTDDDWTCCYCGESVMHSGATLDHVLPRELGGGNEATNLVTACGGCNSAKRHLSLLHFSRYLADKNGTDAHALRKRVRKALKRHSKFEKRGWRKRLARKGSK